MIQTTVKLDYTVAQCIADVKADLEKCGATKEGLESIGSKVQRLAAQPGLVTEEELAEQLQPGVNYSRVMYAEVDGSLYLTLARFPASQFDRVHSHGGWGVICIGAGEDDHIRWRRLDDGSRTGHAELEQVERRGVKAGEIINWEDSDTIHCHHGPQGSKGWELILLGRDQRRFLRPVYEPESHSVTLRNADPSQG